MAVCGPCPSGYDDPAQGTLCVDRNECGTTSDTCDPDPAACVNEPGGFRCACPAGFVGGGVGPNGCSRRVVELAAGATHTCARFENGTVRRS